MPTIVALGEMLIDFAPAAADYPTLKAQPGGAPCNFLAALQKYGCSTAMIGKVGDDRWIPLETGNSALPVSPAPIPG